MAYGDNTQEKHFTATIEVSETIHTTTSSSNRGEDKTTREVREVSRVVIRSKTLEGLRAKVAGHIELISED